MGRVIDLTGQKFGRLTIIEMTMVRKEGQRNYSACKCKCDCGNIKTIRTWGIKKGTTVSCGCYMRESIGNRRRLPPGESAFNTIFLAYKISAESRKYKFELSKEQFKELTSSNCYYCGTEPKTKKRGYNESSGYYTYNGIDRIDNNIGYTIDNVVPCCEVCNRMKLIHSKPDFLKYVKNIYEHLKLEEITL